jgi:tricorn protease
MKQLHGNAVRVGAVLITLISIFLLSRGTGNADSVHLGYYRYPAIHGDIVIFTAEGDLWKASSKGGVATRLTSDAGEETYAAISPDGSTVAFTGEYEGPTEAYTMPIDGGVPQRRTWNGDALVAGWTPDGRLLVRTDRYSDLPDPKLVAIDSSGHREIVPLASAAQGSYTPDGRTLFFTRNDRQPSWTKRYKGGTAENIWRYDTGGAEAVELTADYAGTSDDPMFWRGRVYFLSDRDGVMNVWSMDENGHNLKEETHQRGFDARSASLSDGRIVYQCGADLWLLDLRSGKDAIIPITLVSDFDQLRDYWVTKPLDYLTAAHIAPDGSSAVFTVRGEVFTLPARPGRIAKVAGDSAVRYREARYMPDGKNILALSTKTGETEFWKFPANGEGQPEQVTSDAKVLRWEGIPSPDGNWIAFYDKNDELWLYDAKTKQDKKIARSMHGGFSDLAWSPDSQWLAYVESADNTFDRIKVLNVNTGDIEAVTDDRYNSRTPSWSADGKWMYFLSDRMLNSTVYSPWGPRQPDPNFDRSIKIYDLALVPGLRSPFAPPDELHPDKPAKVEELDSRNSSEPKAPGAKKPAVTVNIDFKGLASRLEEVPSPPGNYSGLQSTDKRLCWLSRDDGAPPKVALECLDIANKGDKPETVMSEVRSFDVSLDRKKMLVRKDDDFYIFDSDAKAAAIGNPQALSKAKIDMSGWTWVTNRHAEFRGLFLDSWRLERDYFYDQHMNGVDWVTMRQRYFPLVDRVTDRNELNDVIAQMVSELSALHTFVRGGDAREPSDHVDVGSLGAVLRRDEQAGGDVVQHIYLHDPDLPNEAPPFARPESLVHEGEVIVSIDGQSVLSVPDTRELLRGKAGHQVLLHVKSANGEFRDVVVSAISASDEKQMRYSEWEYTRRLAVDQDSQGTIGYVHLRAMGPADIAQWARDFYPVYNRQGLIIDVRHNRGGNIDSWVLGKLLRKAWFYFQPRVGDPIWNMQYAFRGHVVVLCDQLTASDGEAFTEGFKRLGLGKVIGMRTWGGEIWLSFGDTAVEDNGVASAAELGVYGPERKWLIEGHGVDPDIAVDDLPHATFEGKDAQLDAGIKLLEEEIQKDPRPVPKMPPYPDKSFKYAQ